MKQFNFIDTVLAVLIFLTLSACMCWLIAFFFISFPKEELYEQEISVIPGDFVLEESVPGRGMLVNQEQFIHLVDGRTFSLVLHENSIEYFILVDDVVYRYIQNVHTSSRYRYYHVISKKIQDSFIVLEMQRISLSEIVESYVLFFIAIVMLSFLFYKLFKGEIFVIR